MAKRAKIKTGGASKETVSAAVRQLAAINALYIECVKCGSPPGEKCKNYKGQNKQTCPERAQGELREAPERFPPDERTLFDGIQDDPPKKRRSRKNEQTQQKGEVGNKGISELCPAETSAKTPSAKTE